MNVRRADIIITINTNTTPSSEVELPIIWFTDYSVQHSLDQFGSLHHLNPGCSASILHMPNWISKFASAAQSSTQISIIIHGNHPWSYEKVSETPSEFLTLIFKISDLRSIKERPLSWRSSYRLSTAHLRRQIQVGEGDANSKSHHYWYTTILFFFFRDLSTIHLPPTMERSAKRII